MGNCGSFENDRSLNVSDMKVWKLAYAIYI